MTWSRSLRFLIIVVVAGGAVGGWLLYRGRGTTSEVPRGQLLYERNCAVCHGLKGDGKGEAAYLLLPKPRNFRAGKFRLVTSQNLQPTREDVFRVITNGMPGTPMPSWAHLAESDRWLLADYVLKLNWQGWVDIALSQGDSRKEAERYATEVTQPGDPIPIPPEPAVTPEGLKLGRKYYLTACANCHGANGEGKRDPTWRTSEGFPTWSRNFRTGVFKGGREGKQLFLRFFTGMPGTPMPAGKLSGEQVWHVVHYVQSLSDPAAQERAQIRAQQIVAKRVAQLPSGPDDALWGSVPEVQIPLMPLWWREGYVDVVRVKAVHDGRRIAFRLEWNDPTRDVGGIRQTAFPDAAAIELTAAADPPLFAMGAPQEVVSIWHWKALWDEDRKSFQDVAQAFPNMTSDAYFGSTRGWRSDPLEDKTFLPALGLNNPVARSRPTSVEKAAAAGLGSYTALAPTAQNVEGTSHWKDGVWRVSLVRELKATSTNDVAFRPGQKVSAAFAIWDGSAGERNGQKTVSIWNTVILEQ